MKWVIQEVSSLGQQLWLVHACGYVVTFSDRNSAQVYAEKLQERVDAPHRLSQEVLRHWAVEHQRMVRGESPLQDTSQGREPVSNKN